GQTPYEFRLDLAMWAYTRTAQYDAAIYPYLAKTYFEMKTHPDQVAASAEPGPVSAAPVAYHPPAQTPAASPQSAHLQAAAGLLPALTPRLRKIQDLRYGENPHQLAAFYRNAASGESGIAAAHQVHGKELSYINILDADAAIELVREFRGP